MRRSPGCGRSRVRTELAIMERCGAIHRRIMEDSVPTMFARGNERGGISCELYSLLVREGHQGIVRFGMFNVDIAVAQLGFGENPFIPPASTGRAGAWASAPPHRCWAAATASSKEGVTIFDARYRDRALKPLKSVNHVS